MFLKKSLCLINHIILAPELHIDCISLLAVLGQGVCENWRASVFSNALRSQEEPVRAAAVKAFPLLLHNLGSTHWNLINIPLLYVHIQAKLMNG